MLALDADLLAYAVNRFAPEHARAAAVVEELVNGERPWALPWPVVYETLGLVTHPHAVARPLRASDAWSFLGLVLASPTVRLLGPTERHAETLVEVLGGVVAERGLPAGLETAVVLREHGVRELLSADAGMKRYAFLTVVDPLRTPGWSAAAPPARRYRVLRTG
jgi:predicted nucleic acid-binding protein